jgi:competence protein ComFC
MTNRAAMLGKWLNAGLGLLYPEACQLCGRERADAAGGFVCTQCQSQVKFIRPPFCQRCGLPFEGDLTTPFECGNCRDLDLHFRSARSAVVAKTIVREAMHRFKYQQALWFEPFLAGLLLREAIPALRGEQWDLIVPVPLYPAKEREREFNQAGLLARHLSRATNIPVNARLLRRVVFTSTQTRLTRTQRAANMAGAFAMAGKIKLNGEKIILVDDVFTTGATTSACARALRRAGAGEVCVWTVARGL